MSKETRPGRPQIPDAERKRSYTVSLSAATHQKAVKMFGTLGKAVEWAVLMHESGTEDKPKSIFNQ
jgi:hypothetical protein